MTDTLENLLERWRDDSEIAENITTWQRQPARQGTFAPFPEHLHPELRASLKVLGIEALYTHQAASWNEAHAGRHVVLSTGTASGKSLGYNLPILDACLRDPEARALYLFPTKALAQDQENSLRQVIGTFSTNIHLPLGTFDGDTPPASRRVLREEARLLLTNPDMLHLGILPHHPRWASFFRGVRFVVIDEMHTYRGVFGSHVANLLRRLMRIAHFYQSYPQFFLTSATIANPEELAQNLIERPISLIADDGSSHGARHFLLYNPPVVNPELGIRRSALSESVRLTGDILTSGSQAILFTGTRRGVELTLTYLRQENPVDPSLIRGYRSGYLPAERREIERGLRSGIIRTVVATNALELGIDIGSMDAVVISGYPGTVSATRQQAGRAGRSTSDSLAVLVASGNPLDQFLVSHPEYLFERSPENALINPDNLLILLDHIRCAAFEMPFHQGESFGGFSPEQLTEFLNLLERAGELHNASGKYFWIADTYPAQDISLRTASASKVLLQTESFGKEITIGEVDFESASWMAHPGAIYLHETRQFEVIDLDLESLTARLKEVNLDYYTQSRNESTVELLTLLSSKPVQGGEKSFGDIRVTTQVTGYQRIRWDTHERIDVIDLDMPPAHLQTLGYWLSLAEDTILRLDDAGAWNNEPNDYGLNWKRQKDRARSRDQYRCQHCGRPERGKAHHVHHKIPFRTFPSFHTANQLSNLITLCPSCHRKAERVVRVRSSLAGLAYTLGHLAPLYLMCDQRDLGIHVDPQSPIAQGKPTVVIYDRIPAGIGLSQRLYEIHEKVLTSALDLVAACPCESGCPSCVGPPGEAGFGGKNETHALLEALAAHKPGF